MKFEFILKGPDRKEGGELPCDPVQTNAVGGHGVRG